MVISANYNKVINSNQLLHPQTNTNLHILCTEHYSKTHVATTSICIQQRYEIDELLKKLTTKLIIIIQR